MSKTKMEEMAKIYQLEVALQISEQFEIVQSDLNREVKQAYLQGWKDCLKHDESVNELVAALEKISGEREMQSCVFPEYHHVLLIETAKETLSKFKEKVGE